MHTVTKDQVIDIIKGSEIIVGTAFGKCTIVCCKLPNGFVIAESSACVDPDNYEEQIGMKACMEKITDKVWELEGYILQNDNPEIYQINEDDSKTTSNVAQMVFREFGMGDQWVWLV